MPPAPAYREVTRRAWWSDARALLWFLVVALVGLLLASVARRTTEGVDADLRSLLAGAPATVVQVALLVAQLVFLVAFLATPVVLLLLRRPGLVLRGGVAAVGAGAAFVAVSLLEFEHASGSSLEPVVSGLGPGPSSTLVAVTAGIVATLGPLAHGAWRRLLWVVLLVLALLRTLSAPDAPLDVVLAIGVGGVIGTLVLLAMGRSVQELTQEGIVATLATVGIAVHGLRPTGHAGSLTARERDGGRALRIRVVDERSWTADRLDRAYRRLRLRDSGDEVAHPTPIRAATSEAMMTLLAADRGVHVPALRAVARAPQGEAILAVDELDASPLADLPADALTPVVLTSVWREVRQLHETRVAHRSLRLTHLLLDADGQVWITGFGRGDAAAADSALANDDAELLAAVYAVVGAERAVGPALDVLGTERLMAAVERVAPASLSASTRAAVKKVGLEQLVVEAARAAGVERPQPVAVERFRPRTLLMGAAFAVALYVLAPQLTDLPTVVSSVRGADWVWLIPLLIASAATYLGAALGLAGGTPGRVPVSEASAVALAGSFIATFSPPGVSTVALNVRFLQKRGYPMPVAVSGSAAKEAAVVIAHVSLLLIFSVWAGSTGALQDELSQLPPARVLILIGLGVVVAIGAAVAVPRVRAALRTTVMPAVRDGAEAMRPVIASPAKMTQLLGGVVLLPLGYGACLWFALEAFGHSVGFVPTVLVSLTAGAVASAAPTPGGIGAVEAVLTASLTAIGVPPATAFAGVLLYRLATFWLPILPGFLSFRVLTARGVL